MQPKVVDNMLDETYLRLIGFFNDANKQEFIEVNK